MSIVVTVCFCCCFSFSEAPLQMRVIFDFMARNGQELSVMKGEVVQVRVCAPTWHIIHWCSSLIRFTRFCTLSGIFTVLMYMYWCLIRYILMEL